KTSLPPVWCPFHSAFETERAAAKAAPSSRHLIRSPRWGMAALLLPTSSAILRLCRLFLRRSRQSLPSYFILRIRWCHNANDVHHSSVFMLQNVAVKHEVPYVRPAEIHNQRNARIRMLRISVPRRHFHHVRVLPCNRGRLVLPVQFEVILRLHQKM